MMNKHYYVLILLFSMIAAPMGYAQVGIFESATDWHSPEEPLGSVKVEGSATLEDGVYSLYGNGNDIWGTSDEGFFLYSTKEGSWQLSARINWWDPGTNDWAKAGVMVRENPEDPESRHYWIELRGADFGDRVDAQWRSTAGGTSVGSEAILNEDGVQLEATVDGIWLRVTRYAPISLFVSEWSLDGNNWHIAHTFTMEGWSDSAAYGLAITNHDDNDFLAWAEFDNVVLREAPAFISIDRDISSSTFVPSDTINVTLDIFNTGEAEEITITETLPDGFTVSAISNGGTEADGTISWTYTLPSSSSELTYTLTAPADYDPAVNGYAATFSGSYGSDNVEIGGDTSIFLFDVGIGDEIFSYDFENSDEAFEWDNLAGLWDAEDGIFYEFEDAGGPLVTLTGEPIADGVITVDAMGLVGDGDWGIVFRGSDIGNFYSWQFVNGTLQLILYSGGTRSTLYTETFIETLNEWQKFQVFMRGNVFYLLFDDEVKAVITDDTHASGQVGLFGWVNAGSTLAEDAIGYLAFDNFIVSELGEQTALVEWALY